MKARKAMVLLMAICSSLITTTPKAFADQPKSSQTQSIILKSGYYAPAHPSVFCFQIVAANTYNGKLEQVVVTERGGCYGYVSLSCSGNFCSNPYEARSYIVEVLGADHYRFTSPEGLSDEFFYTP